MDIIQHLGFFGGSSVNLAPTLPLALSWSFRSFVSKSKFQHLTHSFTHAFSRHRCSRASSCLSPTMLIPAMNVARTVRCQDFQGFCANPADDRSKITMLLRLSSIWWLKCNVWVYLSNDKCCCNDSDPWKSTTNQQDKPVPPKCCYSNFQPMLLL